MLLKQTVFSIHYYVLYENSHPAIYLKLGNNDNDDYDVVVMMMIVMVVLLVLEVMTMRSNFEQKYDPV